MHDCADYRTRIILLGLDRREIAAQMGLSYSSFNYRLLKFGKFTPEQERELRRILNEAETQRQQTVA